MKIGLDRPRQPGEPLRNTRHEAYAQKVAAGIPPKQAYASLYKETTRTIPADERGEIRARIVELQKASAEQVTAMVRHNREAIMGDLIKNQDRAFQATAVFNKKGEIMTEKVEVSMLCDCGNAVTGSYDANIYKYDGTVVNKALELRMKDLGLGVERKETHVIHSRELAALSKGEIEQLLLDTARQYGYRLVKTEEVREPDAAPPHRLQ